MPLRLFTAVRAVLTKPKFWAVFHAIGFAIWLGLSWPGLTAWRTSITFVIVVSLYAIQLSHLVGFVAAIGARKADPDDPL